jgi:hypothetical protein
VDKKPLIVVCICAVVLLVLGSLSNVVGYQIKSSTTNQINETGIKVVGVYLKKSWGYIYPFIELVFDIQNVGTKDITEYEGYGECHRIFIHPKDIIIDGFHSWIGVPWKPQEIRSISFFTLPLRTEERQNFYEVNLSFSTVIPEYNTIIFQGKYRFYQSSVSNMSGIWFWLANLIGR